MLSCQDAVFHISYIFNHAFNESVLIFRLPSRSDEDDEDDEDDDDDSDDSDDLDSESSPSASHDGPYDDTEGEGSEDGGATIDRVHGDGSPAKDKSKNGKDEANNSQKVSRIVKKKKMQVTKLLCFTVVVRQIIRWKWLYARRILG